MEGRHIAHNRSAATFSSEHCYEASQALSFRDDSCGRSKRNEGAAHPERTHGADAGITAGAKIGDHSERLWSSVRLDETLIPSIRYASHVWHCLSKASATLTLSGDMVDPCGLSILTVHGAESSSIHVLFSLLNHETRPIAMHAWNGGRDIVDLAAQRC